MEEAVMVEAARAAVGLVGACGRHKEGGGGVLGIIERNERLPDDQALLHSEDYNAEEGLEGRGGGHTEGVVKGGLEAVTVRGGCNEAHQIQYHSVALQVLSGLRLSCNSGMALG